MHLKYHSACRFDFYLEKFIPVQEPFNFSVHEVAVDVNALVRPETFNGISIFIQDADLEYDPAEIPEVIGPIVRGQADVVYGSRFLGGCVDRPNDLERS